MTIQVDPTSELVDRHWLAENVELGEKSHRRIPAHYQAAEITHDDVRAWAQKLVAQSVAHTRAFNPSVTRGRSLLILGPTGTGKTHQAYGVIRALTTSGLSVSWRVITAADLYAQMRPRAGADSEKTFREYANTGLLVLDDVGAAKASEWVEEVNYRLINHRYEREMPTVLTSNVPLQMLRTELGDRVTSRLAEMADRVVLEGKDRRRSR